MEAKAVRKGGGRLVGWLDGCMDGGCGQAGGREPVLAAGESTGGADRPAGRNVFYPNSNSRFLNQFIYFSSIDAAII